MNTELDATHDPKLESWVDSANSTASDFPIQNLPFGRFRRKYQRGADGSWHIGVAIGDHVLDLKAAGLLVHVGHELVIENRRRDGGNEANCCREQRFGDAGRHNS